MRSFLITDVPVLHNGYINLFRKHQPTVAGIYIIGKKFRAEAMFHHEEIRALPPADVRTCIEALDIFSSVEILDFHPPRSLQECHIIRTNDALTRRIVDKYFPDSEIEEDTAFLRWDRDKVLSVKDARFDRMSDRPFDRDMIHQAIKEGAKSSDWWRQVGAVAVRDGEILSRAFNCHLPNEQIQYALGDPRDSLQAGERTDLCSAIHAEESIIADAARQVLDGIDFYLSVFPCSWCAKTLARCGIRRLYYSSGHANLDGLEVLKAYGVEIVFVDMEDTMNCDPF